MVGWARRAVIARIEQTRDFDGERVRRRGHEVQRRRRIEGAWFTITRSHPLRAPGVPVALAISNRYVPPALMLKALVDPGPGLAPGLKRPPFWVIKEP